MVDWYVTNIVDTGRSAALFAILGFLVTFAITRWITIRIRNRAASGVESEGGAIKDIHIGGVHVHHQVWGILLVLVVGLLVLRYEPDSPWREILAALFGIGAALALDEFALWLHLEDVYWSEEGRKSLDAVMIAVVIGLALLVTTSPLGVDREQVETEGVAGAAIAVLLHIGLAIVTLLKGKLVMGLISLPMPFVGLVGAIRLAKPGSFWARRFYKEKKMARSAKRFDGRQEARLERVRDLLSGTRR